MGQLSTSAVTSTRLDLDRLQIEPSLANTDKASLLSLIHDFPSLFVQDYNDLGRTSLITHSIDTGEHQPIKQQPYRITQQQRAVIETEIQKMLDK